MANKNIIIAMVGIMAIVGAMIAEYTIYSSLINPALTRITDECIDCDIGCNNLDEVTEDTTTKHRHAPPATKPPRKCWYWLGVKWCV